MNIRIWAVAALAFTLTACEGMSEREFFGTILGGAAGAAVGAQVGDGQGQLAAVAAGAVIGALIGGDIGRQLDRADRQYMENTAQTSLESDPAGTSREWSNPDSGNAGTITPSRTYKKDSGQYCREYQQTVTVGGEEQQAYGTACRQDDGTWQIVSN
jgi:surface antigen